MLSIVEESERVSQLVRPLALTHFQAIDVSVPPSSSDSSSSRSSTTKPSFSYSFLSSPSSSSSESSSDLTAPPPSSSLSDASSSMNSDLTRYYKRVLVSRLLSHPLRRVTGTTHLLVLALVAVGHHFGLFCTLLALLARALTQLALTWHLRLRLGTRVRFRHGGRRPAERLICTHTWPAVSFALCAPTALPPSRAFNAPSEDVAISVCLSTVAAQVLVVGGGGHSAAFTHAHNARGLLEDLVGRRSRPLVCTPIVNPSERKSWPALALPLSPHSRIRSQSELKHFARMFRLALYPAIPTSFILYNTGLLSY